VRDRREEQTPDLLVDCPPPWGVDEDAAGEQDPAVLDRQVDGRGEVRATNVVGAGCTPDTRPSFVDRVARSLLQRAQHQLLRAVALNAVSESTWPFGMCTIRPVDWAAEDEMGPLGDRSDEQEPDPGEHEDDDQAQGRVDRDLGVLVLPEFEALGQPVRHAHIPA
jgi:hypothetical protein